MQGRPIIGVLALLATVLTSQATTLNIGNSCYHRCICNGRNEHIETVCQTFDKIHCSEAVLKNKDLRGTRLIQVEASFLNDINHLDLSNCQLDFVNPDAFQDLQNVQVINLSGNKISRLTSEHFKNLPKLDVVHLNKNARHDCQKLRRALPEITFHCGPHVTTWPSSTLMSKELPPSDMGLPEVKSSTQPSPSMTGYAGSASTKTSGGASSEGCQVIAAGEGVSVTWLSGFLTGVVLMGLAGFFVEGLISARRRRNERKKESTSSQSLINEQIGSTASVA